MHTGRPCPHASKESRARELDGIRAAERPLSGTLVLIFPLCFHLLFDALSAQVIAAIQAVKQLKGLNFEVRLTKMVKNIPGGIFTMMHNANRRRQHGF